MTEVGRLLRYAVPGGIFELLVGLWLVDAYDYLAPLAVDLSGGGAVAAATLLVAAAFPLGYLISVIANEVAWLARRFCLERRVWGRIETRRVVEIVQAGGRHRRWLATVRTRMNLDAGNLHTGRRNDEAFVEVALRMAHGGKAYQAAVDRVRSLADQMNSLINSCVAVALALLVCLAVLGATCALGREDPDNARWALMVLFLGVSVGLVTCIWSAERRVANITEAFVISMILGGWRPDDTE